MTSLAEQSQRELFAVQTLAPGAATARCGYSSADWQIKVLQKSEKTLRDKAEKELGGAVPIVPRESLEENFKLLSPREEKILSMRFGDPKHTLEEVGQEFDVTRERIRQIEARALRKIRGEFPQEALRRGPKNKKSKISQEKLASGLIEDSNMPKAAKKKFRRMGLVYVRQLPFLTEYTVLGDRVGRKGLARLKEQGMHFLPGHSPFLMYFSDPSRIFSGAYLAAGLSNEEKMGLAKIQDAADRPSIDHLYALMQDEKGWNVLLETAQVSGQTRGAIEKHIAHLYSVLRRRNLGESQEPFWDPFAETRIHSDAALKLISEGDSADWAAIGLSTEWMKQWSRIQFPLLQSDQFRERSWDAWYNVTNDFYNSVTDGVSPDWFVAELREALLRFEPPGWVPLPDIVKDKAWRVITTASSKLFRIQLQAAWRQYSSSSSKLDDRADEVRQMTRTVFEGGYFELAMYLRGKRWTAHKLALWLRQVFKEIAKDLGLEDSIRGPDTANRSA